MLKKLAGSCSFRWVRLGWKTRICPSWDERWWSCNRMKRCFQIQAVDNVAVLLEDASAEALRVIGGGQIQSVILGQPIALGHKVALSEIAQGDPIVKFGVPIG